MNVLYISGSGENLPIPGQRADFLSKPFSAASLKGKVRDLLEIISPLIASP